MQAVFSECKDPTAEASLAAILDCINLGMAIAAIIKMMATTIKSSISEKPLSFFRMGSSLGFWDRTGQPITGATPGPDGTERVTILDTDSKHHLNKDLASSGRSLLGSFGNGDSVAAVRTPKNVISGSPKVSCNASLE